MLLGACRLKKHFQTCVFKTRTLLSTQVKILDWPACDAARGN